MKVKLVIKKTKGRRKNMRCKNCGKTHKFFISGKCCFDEELTWWLVENADDWGANWCLLKRHFLKDLREAGYDIIKKEAEKEGEK